MTLQQFSGLNALSFNAAEIFRVADFTFNRLICVVIINAVQVYTFTISFTNYADDFVFSSGFICCLFFYGPGQNIQPQAIVHHLRRISLSFNALHGSFLFQFGHVKCSDDGPLQMGSVDIDDRLFRRHRLRFRSFAVAHIQRNSTAKISRTR